MKIKLMPKSSMSNRISTNVNVQKVGGLAASKPSPLKLSPKVYEYRKFNHMYFRCGEKYTQGHRCKMKQLQCIVGTKEELPQD